MAKSAVHDGAGDGDIRATNNPEGTYLAGNAGDDVLRGGKYNDILVGGEGNDLMFGGAGADTFRFYGDSATSSAVKPAGADVDKIFDLSFAEGDRLDFTGFGEAAANAVIKSFADLVALVGSSGWTATEQAPNNPNNDNLVLSYDFGGGISQTIIISHGWDAFVAASTPV